MLANKCGLACRLDNYLVKPTNKFGIFFKKQLEARVANPTDSALGKRNIECMEKLVEEMTNEGEYLNHKEE